MSTYQPPGQSTSIIDTPRSLVTDGEVSKSNRDRLLSGVAFAPALKHAKKQDAHLTSLRQSRANRLAAAHERRGNALGHRNLTVIEYQKTGTALTVEATAEDDEIIREADEEIAALTKMKVPTIDLAEVMRQAPRFRSWQRHEKTYFDGDPRHPDDKRKGAKADRLEKQNAFDEIQHAPRPSADAIPSMLADLRVRADKGKPVVGSHLAGYTFDLNGRYQLNKNSRTEFPEMLSKPNQFSQDLAMVDDTLNFLIWANFDSVAAALKKQILEEARDEDAIRDADRPALLAKAAAELLEAQRAEEYCNKQCERMGIPVFRPSNWPVEVLLEVERPTSITTPPAPVEDNEDAPDFEEDEAAA